MRRAISPPFRLSPAKSPTCSYGSQLIIPDRSGPSSQPRMTLARRISAIFSPFLAARARCAGVAPAGIDVIEDAAASDVLWLRAYVAVHAALATTRPVFELVA